MSIVHLKEFGEKHLHSIWADQRAAVRHCGIEISSRLSTVCHLWKNTHQPPGYLKIIDKTGINLQSTLFFYSVEERKR